MIRHLGDPRVIALALAVVAAAAIWTLGGVVRWNGAPLLPSAADRALIAGGLVVLAALAVAGVTAWGIWRARRDSRRLAGSLGASEGLAAVTRGGPEELGVVADRFQHALDLIQRDAMGGRFVSRLPWYIVIGPPGAGKTSLLAHAELDLPLAEELGLSGIQGIGGTRNCEWWFTGEAVFLDTAGRYTTHDSHGDTDRAVWTGFLDLIRQHRPDQPVNGLIVALSLADFLAEDDALRAFHADAVHERIQEVMGRFGRRVPVYVVFTKCDLVAGFREFFQGLDDKTRRGAWGVAFPPDPAATPVGVLAEFRNRFRALLGRLEDRVVGQMAAMTDDQARPLAYLFPREMAALAAPLEAFLDRAMRPASTGPRPLVRGVWFTSATEEGAPVDRLAAAAGWPGLGPMVLPPTLGDEPARFIPGLFRDIVLPEAVQEAPRPDWRAIWRWRAAAAAAGIAVLAAGLLWWVSWASNSAALAAIDDSLDHYEAERPPVTAQEPAAAVPALMALRAAAGAFPAEGVPFGQGFGLYQGREIAPAATDAYHRALIAELLPRLRARLAAEVDAVRHDPRRLKDALAMYLMLGEPDRLEPAALAAWLSARWAEDPGLDADRRRQLASLTDDLLALSLPAETLDSAVVDQARGHLRRVDLPDRIYEALKAEATGGVAAFDLAQTLGPAGTRVFAAAGLRGDHLRVPGLYTRAGLTSLVAGRLPALAREMVAETTVDPDPERVAAVVRQVAERYVQDYVRAWDDMLSQVRLQSIHDLGGAHDMLRRLASMDSPLLAILAAVQDNTDLPANAPAPALGVARAPIGRPAPDWPSGAWPGPAIARHFAPLNALLAPGPEGESFGRAMAALGTVADDLGRIDQAADPGRAAWEAAAGRMERDGRDGLGKLRDAAGLTPGPVNGWLAQIADQVWALMLTAAREQVNSAWARQVADACRYRIATSWPMAPGAEESVSLADFTGFFGPGGTLDGFRRQWLAPFLDGGDNRYVDGLSLDLDPAALDAVLRAGRIRRQFFPEGDLGFDFTLTPASLDADAFQFILNYDGKTVTYRHGPRQPTELRWPAGNGGDVTLTFIDTDRQAHSQDRTGPWALFRLFESSDLLPTAGDGVYRVGFEVDGLHAVYDVTVTGNRFSLAAVANYTCPDQL